MINLPETLDPQQDYETEAKKPAATDLPLSPGKVLLDLNADGVIDVLAARCLSDDPGNCTTRQKAYDYSRTAVNPKAYTGLWCQNLLMFPLSTALGAQKHGRPSPGVSQRLLGGVAHAGILLHHVADEVFSCG